jgi:hypothetical protein
MSSPVRHSRAYLSGWQDGLYGEQVSFTENRRLAELQEPSERLDYYRGHRAGSESRPRRRLLAAAS